jgi:hypothetical protein
VAIVTTFHASTPDVSNSTTYTFAAQNIGPAASDRVVVVTSESRGSGSSVTIVSVTIGGISATVYQRSNAAATSNISAIAFAVVPTGTTADVVITFSAGRLRCNIGVFSLAGASTTVNDDASDASTATSHTLSIAVNAGGAVFGSSNNASVKTSTWTGIAEVYDGEIEAASGFYATGAYSDFASGSTASVVVTPSASAILTSIALSLDPASSGTTYTQLERQIRGVNRGVYSGS